MPTVFRSPWLGTTALVLSLAAAGCTERMVESPRESAFEKASDGPQPKADGVFSDPPPVAPIPTEVAPVLETTDVSILYPLPVRGESQAFLRPSEGGMLGPLFPRSLFAEMVPRGRLDDKERSDYDALAVVALRLDPTSCYSGSGCEAQIRVVLQGLHTDATTGDTVAADGALHVIYTVPHEEVLRTMRELLAAKARSRGPSSKVLEAHPILTNEGLSGPFAIQLRDIATSHLGEWRIKRVTVFDHATDAEGDLWSFRMFDRGTKTGAGFSPVEIPMTKETLQTVRGSGAHVPLGMSFADASPSILGKDLVADLVRSSRPSPGTPEANALASVFESAIRIENPEIHDPSSSSCTNCHLAEGAHRLGEKLFGFVAKPQRDAVNQGQTPARRDERTSVTNLHSFGYLGREVSISQRTANESALVASTFFRSRGIPR